MAPKDSALHQHAAYLRDLCPEHFSSADVAYARLQELKALLWSRGANLKARCVPGRPLGCELQNQLEQWNPILFPIPVLLEIRDGSGELVAVVSSAYGYFDDRDYCRQRAMILFHWLLVNHSCVTAIRVEKYGRLCYPLGESLFVDGVAKCTRLRSLQLCYDCYSWGFEEKLLNAMLSLSNLEEVTFKKLYPVNERKSMKLLAMLISKNAKLHRLAVESVRSSCTKRPGMSPVIAAIKSTAAISELCLDVTPLKKEEYRPFCEALNVHKSLKSLQLIATQESSTLSVAAVAKVVDASKTLIKLQLTNFRADISEFWALTRSLSSAAIIQELAIVSCTFSVSRKTRALISGPAYEGDLNPGVCITDRLYFHMVRTLTSLRKLRMPLSFTTEKKRLFFEALEKNGSIEEVHFEGGEKSYRVIRDTSNGWVIERVGCYDPLSDRMLEGERVRSVCLPVVAIAETLRRFRQLRMLQDLTTLTVTEPYYIEDEQAEILAQFLGETKSLNKFQINFKPFYGLRAQTRMLLDGIRHNTSITVLVVERLRQYVPTTRLLVDIVCSSKRIRAFSYNMESGRPCLAFFPMLAKAIQNNCTLISVEADQYDAEARHLDHIKKVLARNNALPIRAAMFVTGLNVDKRGAEALELLGPDPVVVSKVREMMSMGEIEAEDATRTKLSDLDDMNAFMRAAGVVRESVVCDGRPSLDALPFFCWLHMRRYLRVADVVDRPGMR